jgi:hypothetical protein
MAIQLTDDGTMDTVLKCSKCGEGMRYNFDGAEDTDAGEQESEEAYDEFVKWAISDAADAHECGEALAPLEGGI